MTLNEALSTGGMVTLTGLIIVFAVLIILMLVMMAMKQIFYKSENAPEPVASEPVVKTQVATPKEDPNLIAVLTAAVAASLNTSTYNLNIKSYRRVSNNAPAWNKAGLNDVIDSRF